MVVMVPKDDGGQRTELIQRKREACWSCPEASLRLRRQDALYQQYVPALPAIDTGVSLFISMSGEAGGQS